MSDAPVQVIVAAAPLVEVEVAAIAPVAVLSGVQGPPGPPGEARLAGYSVITTQLVPGDHVEFTGAAWTNIHKFTLADGGNF